MSIMRRICAVLTGLGSFAGLAVLQLATAENCLGKPLPVPPPPAVGGAAAAPAPLPPGPEAGPEGEFTDAITLPTDRKAKRSIDLAEDFIKEEDWAGAAETLQGLLDTKEDLFLQVKRKGPDGKTETVH